MHRRSAPSRGEGLTRPRDRWERSWAKPAEDFQWFRARIEPIIAEAARTDLPPGAAIDVGCGAGVVTHFLGERFPVALGLDLAFGAVEQARARDAGHDAVFGVADACMLPLRDSSASFMVDRGCLHCLSVSRASRYLNEISRVLSPGGRFVLVARMVRARPPLGWALRNPLRAATKLVPLIRGNPPGSLARVLSADDSIAALLPDTLEVEHIERDRLRSDSGWHLRHVRLVARQLPT